MKIRMRYVGNDGVAGAWITTADTHIGSGSVPVRPIPTSAWITVRHLFTANPTLDQMEFSTDRGGKWVAERLFDADEPEFDSFRCPRCGGEVGSLWQWDVWHTFIKRVQVERVTEESVWIGGKEWPRHDSHSYFDTFAEAKKCAVGRARKEHENARCQFDDAIQRLLSVIALEEPKEDAEHPKV